MTIQVEIDPSKILKVYIRTKSETIQAADMETIGHPMCTNTRSPVDKLGKGGVMLTQDQQILLDAVTRASEKLDLKVEVIDISEYSLFKRLRLKEIVPRIEYCGQTLEGLPDSQAVIQFVRSLSEFQS
jgi:hypothetical protein